MNVVLTAPNSVTDPRQHKDANHARAVRSTWYASSGSELQELDNKVLREMEFFRGMLPTGVYLTQVLRRSDGLSRMATSRPHRHIAKLSDALRWRCMLKLTNHIDLGERRAIVVRISVHLGPPSQADASFRHCETRGQTLMTGGRSPGSLEGWNPTRVKSRLLTLAHIDHFFF